MTTCTRRGFLGRMGTALAAAATTPWLRVAVAWSQQAVPFKLGPVVLGDLAIMAPVLVGVEKGFFREAGIAPEVITFTGGPPLLRGVLAGTVDVGLTGATDALVFRAQGAPIRAVAVITERNHFTLIAAPGITRVADLKGKAIGVTAVGATTWVFARMLAKQQGWDPVRDVRIVGLGGLDAQMAALRRGEIQAFIFGDAGALAEHLGVGKILLRLDEVTPKWISEIAYTTSDVIRKRKDDLRKLLQGYFRAQRFCRDNAEETIRIAAKGIGWPEPAARRAYENTRPLWSTDGRFDLEALKFMQDTLLELGVLTVRWPLADHYTAEFVPVRG
jgi:NitT/TauT family transport system substrate-binding protein